MRPAGAEHSHPCVNILPVQGLDIGPNSIDLLKNTLKGAKTVIWNGPMGVFEVRAWAAHRALCLPGCLQGIVWAAQCALHLPGCLQTAKFAVAALQWLLWLPLHKLGSSCAAAPPPSRGPP